MRTEGNKEGWKEVNKRKERDGTGQEEKGREEKERERERDRGLFLFSLIPLAPLSLLPPSAPLSSPVCVCVCVSQETVPPFKYSNLKKNHAALCLADFFFFYQQK
jgi:hypothetical protein